MTDKQLICFFVAMAILVSLPMLFVLYPQLLGLGVKP